jgi:carbon-monoxide dehydrogenase medium subunit
VPVVRRLDRAEAFLAGRTVTADVAAEAAALVAADIEPLSDLRGSADYRREMVRVNAQRTLEAVFGLAA